MKILHAERRDWADEKAAVQKWQWFIALDAQPEFRRWLIETNPFELSRAEAPVTAAQVNAPPEWFPPLPALGAMTTYRIRGGGFLVFVDGATSRIYATDAGGGFAAPSR